MKWLLLAIVCLSVRAQNSVPPPPEAHPEPENLADTLDRLVRYHDYGEYDYRIRQIANAARDYLQARVKDKRQGERLAAVFDIDETALSNWRNMLDCGFCSYSAQLRLYPPPATDPPIVPVLELYKFAKENGVAVFFVTGRQEKQRAATEKNLENARYPAHDNLRERSGLLMQSDGNTDPASVFKPRDRQLIEDEGYRIVLNIGDQASDLTGCCAERVFKLPNPFYLIK
ncbi:MAG: HAD family acid phosphatase [Bryobacteraceae bacterium]|jgi:predicted secreted acid phosphatase